MNIAVIWGLCAVAYIVVGMGAARIYEWPICTVLFFLGCVLRLIKRAWKGARTDDSKIQTKRNDRYVSLSARATGAIKGAVLLPTRWP